MLLSQPQMKKPLVKIGAIGTVLVAICCFTPLLVWFLGVVGLLAMVGYLDLILFPLLGLFIILLLIGLLQGAGRKK